MRIRTAVLELLKAEPEWRRFFRSCCETSSFRLRAQTWQFRDELAVRGHALPKGLSEVEDALMALARELLPDSPAAEWDSDWAVGLCKDALARLAEYCADLSASEIEALDLSGQDEWDEKMYRAGLANDPVAFRQALKRWERAGIEALEELGRVGTRETGVA